MYISVYIGGKPCGRQVFERNRDLECRIKQVFQVQGGCEMSVESFYLVLILDQIKEYLFYATQGNISLAFIQDVKEGAVVNSILFNVPYSLFIAI